MDADPVHLLSGGLAGLCLWRSCALLHGRLGVRARQLCAHKAEHQPCSRNSLWLRRLQCPYPHEVLPACMLHRQRLWALQNGFHSGQCCFPEQSSWDSCRCIPPLLAPCADLLQPHAAMPAQRPRCTAPPTQQWALAVEYPPSGCPRPQRRPPAGTPAACRWHAVSRQSGRREIAGTTYRSLPRQAGQS